MSEIKGKLEITYNDIKRIVDGKLISRDDPTPYEELSEKIFGQDQAFNSSEVRKRLYGMKRLIDIIEKEKEEKLEDSGDLDIQREIQELKKERYKIRDERNILNQYLREQSRCELIIEEITNAIKEVKLLEPPKRIKNEENLKHGILCIADFHYDSDFEIKGLNGEILNKYNPEVFKDRMWRISEFVKDIVEENNLTQIDIFDLGDDIDGILRVSALNHIRDGITKSCIDLGTFLIEWLNYLSRFVNIKFTKISGNHEDLRIVTGKKGDFPTENMSKILLQFLKLGLQNNKNVEIIENINEDISYTNIGGVDIVIVHEISGDKYMSIKNYENMYKKNIDVIIGGHSHYSNSQTVGIDKEVIGVPSIVGIDEYSMQLRKTSNAGAKFIIVKDNYGIYTTYDIKLK